MPYATRAEIEALLPASALSSALTDGKSGGEIEGLFDRIQAAADLEVDAILGSAFPLPLAAPLPPLVRRAAAIFCLRAIYSRKGIGKDENPWSEAADQIRELLEGAASGKLSLRVSDASLSGWDDRFLVFGDPSDSARVWEVDP